jgi:hypothetical protein
MVKHERNVTGAIWLLRQNYHVVPLNPRLGGHTLELKRAIQRGISAHPDLHRDDFYGGELQSGWGYIHVRDKAKTVYLVAHSSSTSSNSSPTRNGSESEPKGLTTRMPEDESRAPNTHGARSNWLSRLSRVVRMEMSQAEFVTTA